MHKWLTVILLGLLMATTGCRDEENTLYIYNWSDYLDPTVVAEFEEANNCDVVVDSFEDNESMMAKLLAGGGGYDIIFPSSYATPVMYQHGLIADLEMTNLPNVVAYIDTKFIDHFHAGTMRYSIPYAFSLTGIIYRKDKVDIPENYVLTESWDLLTSNLFANRVCILRDMREVLGIGLIMNGYSINTTNNPTALKQALKTAKKYKKAATKLDNEQYRSGIINGEIYISMAYVADMLQIQMESPTTPIEFFIPNEGSTCCWDEMVIAKKSKHKELAYKFINYLYDPKVAAKNVNYVLAMMPNKGMYKYMDEDLRTNEWISISKSKLNQLELIRDLGPEIKLYNKAWDEFNANHD